jgi:hypothetical protein
MSTPPDTPKSESGSHKSFAPTPQRFPFEQTVLCNSCCKHVIFSVVRTVRCPKDPTRCYTYLVCPNCGARATQIRAARPSRSKI